MGTAQSHGHTGNGQDVIFFIFRHRYEDIVRIVKNVGTGHGITLPFPTGHGMTGDEVDAIREKCLNRIGRTALDAGYVSYDGPGRKKA